MRAKNIFIVEIFMLVHKMSSERYTEEVFTRFTVQSKGRKPKFGTAKKENHLFIKTQRTKQYKQSLTGLSKQ